VKSVVAIMVLAPLLAHADPFDVLRDTAQRWHYEVVRGKTPQSLKTVAAAPTATCGIEQVKTDDVLPVAHLSCTADSKPTNGDLSFGGMTGLVVDQDRYLTFDAAGVREVLSGSTGDILKDKFNTGGFAFPATVSGAWKVRLAKDDLRVVLDGAVRTVKVRGTAMKAWFETGTYGFPDQKVIIANAFIPSVGPYLLCTYDTDTREYWCLRLTAYEKT
jgi:hypothetical protein